MDHFATVESEAYEYTRNIISTLNFELPEESSSQSEEPLYASDDLLGLAPRSYDYSMDVRLVRLVHLLPDLWCTWHKNTQRVVVISFLSLYRL